MANTKIEAQQQADLIISNLSWLNGEHAQARFLFSDVQTISHKQHDDFKLVVQSRITAHEAAEAEKLEALRLKVQVEEQQKAHEKERANEAVLRLKIQQEEEAKAQANVKAELAQQKAAATIAAAKAVKPISTGMGTHSAATPNSESVKPSPQQMVDVIADMFNVAPEIALAWLIATNFSQLNIAA